MGNTPAPCRGGCCGMRSSPEPCQPAGQVPVQRVVPLSQRRRAAAARPHQPAAGATERPAEAKHGGDSLLCVLWPSTGSSCPLGSTLPPCYTDYRSTWRTHWGQKSQSQIRNQRWTLPTVGESQCRWPGIPALGTPHPLNGRIGACWRTGLPLSGLIWMSTLASRGCWPAAQRRNQDIV